MKSIGRILALFVLGLSLAGNAWADRGHGHGYGGHGYGHDHGHFRGNVRFGVNIDPFWGWPFYYPSPYYYPPLYPPVVTVPAPPPVYVEQGSAIDAAPPAAAYWYYCADSRSYYPYVAECPGGWQRVAPQPPPAPQ